MMDMCFCVACQWMHIGDDVAKSTYSLTAPVMVRWSSSKIFGIDGMMRDWKLETFLKSPLRIGLDGHEVRALVKVSELMRSRR